jgi:tetratricopeptide (TPR) repeat protein
MNVSLSALFIQLTGLCLWVAPLSAKPEEAITVKWIKDLASETFQVREKASLELWKLGDAAMPALREAVLSNDPEVVMRAREAVEKLELKISTDTPEKTLLLIEAYRKAPSRQKMELLNALKEEKAFYQLLKLYSMENEKEQAELAMSVQDVAVFAAREAIVKDDIELAIELLRMAPPKHNELMALACLYRSIGQLDQQFANLNPPQNVNPELWKGYLLRVKGDLDAAIVNAEETKQFQLLAGLKALQGDPVLWLDRNNSPGVRPQHANDAYVNIALKRWKGELVKESDFDPLLRLLKGNSRMQRNQAMISLASLGKYELIEKAQIKENSLFAYTYYLSREETNKALGALGLDPDKPDYSAWVKKRFGEINTGDESDMVITQLMILAGFMERRGLDKELEGAFSPHFAEMQKKDPGVFLDFITRFYDGGLGAPHFTIEQASKWAGEDEDRWGEIFAAILGEDDTVMEWLVWIREVDPKMKDREAIEAMLAIFQLSPSSGNLREKWMIRLWQEVKDEKNEELKTKYVRQIMSLCISQKDVLNTLKAWDMLDAKERASAQWGTIDMYLSAAGRWKEAAEILVSMRKGRVHASPEIHAHLAATLRRGGMEEQARVHEEMADKLALGSAPTSMRMGGYYFYAGDFERADMWFKRATLEADPTDGEFLTALEKYSEKHVRDRNWKLAASCQEVIMHIYASQSYRNGALSELAKSRMSADLSKAMAILPDDKEKALKILKEIHQAFKPDGVLADDFFPALREVGLKKELEEWFGESWDLMVKVIDDCPKSRVTRNTAAWFASRTGLKLAEAEKYLKVAIQMSPEEAAYLDTMAELKFAKGDRKAAVEWSQRAVCFDPFDDVIRLQNERFRNAPLPKY